MITKNYMVKSSTLYKYISSRIIHQHDKFSAMIEILSASRICYRRRSNGNYSLDFPGASYLYSVRFVRLAKRLIFFMYCGGGTSQVFKNRFSDGFIWWR